MFTAKPSAPGQPTIVEMHKDSAKIKWTKPRDDGGAPVSNYRLEMRTLGSFRWDLVNVLDKVKDTEYKVDDLLEDTDYEFRVLAENRAGVGEPSAASRSAKYGKETLLNHAIQIIY